MENIISSIADPATRFDAHKIRQGAVDFYDLEKAVFTYVQLYKKILG
jgi:hypothetical protein